jgi:two-component system, chemotaxis family, chemotaxis protein CheY
MKKCLVVDDSRVIRKVARKILEELNFETDEAEDGVAALEACRAKMPDAILLDGHMPNMSGVEFLRALRRETGGNKPIVVFCTAENDVAEITEAVGAGANEYLLKPFDREAMKATLADAGLFA